MHGGWDTDDDLDGSGAEPLGERDPRRIGRFALVGVLGSGGMGRVYLGLDAPGRCAAVKQVLPELSADEGFLRHFGQELDNLARLPAGVSARLLDSDRNARPPWFATEYIPGLTLTEALRVHGGPLPVVALWALLRDAAAGLAEVHALDMVHRDLKPSNVMLTPAGVTLIDFGVARAADQSGLTKTGTVIGTPAYMAPEQASAQKQLTGAADVFALASVLSYAAIGAPPFGEGAGLDVLYRIVHDEPALGPVRAVDARLADILRSCLDKDPTARPTAAELNALARAHTEDGSQAAPWPAAVTERVGARAAFAAGAPDPADFPAPGGTLPVLPGTGRGGTASETGEGGWRKRRRKVLLLAVPLVVAAAATLATLLAPGNGEAQDAGSPGSSVTASSTAGSGAKPSATAPHPSAGTRTPSHGPSSAATGPARGKGAAGQSGGGAASGPGGSAAGSGAASGGGSATSGGTTAGSSGTGGSGGSAQPATPAPPSGQGQVTSYSNAQCLGDVTFIAGHSPQMAPCGSQDPLAGTRSYTWTYTAGSGGTFQLVSQGAGSCLTDSSFGSLATLSSCDGSTGQQWRIGATTEHGSTYQNVSSGQCLVVGSGKNVGTATCDSSQSRQVWYKS